MVSVAHQLCVAVILREAQAAAGAWCAVVCTV